MHDRGRKTDYIRDHRPRGLSIAEGCRLMELSRATFYEQPDSVADDTATVEAIAVICNEFEHMAGVVFAPLFGKKARSSITRRFAA